MDQLGRVARIKRRVTLVFGAMIGMTPNPRDGHFCLSGSDEPCACEWFVSLAVSREDSDRRDPERLEMIRIQVTGDWIEDSEVQA